MRSFTISDGEKVKEYLLSRLVLLQQQTNKRIAKAWIKGICPKKQARFPYQNKLRRERDGLNPEIPEWWPIEQCAFVEPDHIHKERKCDVILLSYNDVLISHRTDGSLPPHPAVEADAGAAEAMERRHCGNKHDAQVPGVDRVFERTHTGFHIQWT